MGTLKHFQIEQDLTHLKKIYQVGPSMTEATSWPTLQSALLHCEMSILRAKRSIASLEWVFSFAFFFPPRLFLLIGLKFLLFIINHHLVILFIFRAVMGKQVFNLGWHFYIFLIRKVKKLCPLNWIFRMHLNFMVCLYNLWRYLRL